MPNSYWQGVTTSGPGKPLFFSGIFTGLHRTAPSLKQTGSADPVIPPLVSATEGYNHVGDIGYQGGRVLLPLECYTPGGPNGGNTCGTGSIGVADPATLAFQYHVKLDPAEIPKAMWVEASPDGQLLWTSSGADLLAYRRSGRDSAANAAPGAAPIHSVRRLAGAVPPERRYRRRLLPRPRCCSPARRARPTRCGRSTRRPAARRLELELPKVQGESEGLAQLPLLGGRLHYLVAPLAAQPTFGPSVGMLHFTTGPLRRARAEGHDPLAECDEPHADGERDREATRPPGRGREGQRGRLHGHDEPPRGRAAVRPKLGVPGTFAAMASKGRAARPLGVRALRAGDRGGDGHAAAPSRSLDPANYGIEGGPGGGWSTFLLRWRHKRPTPFLSAVVARRPRARAVGGRV